MKFKAIIKKNIKFIFQFNYDMEIHNYILSTVFITCKETRNNFEKKSIAVYCDSVVITNRCVFIYKDTINDSIVNIPWG